MPPCRMSPLSLDNPAPALARWFDRRLHETGTASAISIHGLTIIDQDDLDAAVGLGHGPGARAALLADGEDAEDLLVFGSHPDAGSFDAIALVRHVWLPTAQPRPAPAVPGGAPGGRVFTGRARARAVAVVGEAGAGCVVRYVDDPYGPVVVGGPAAAGLVVPLAALWSRSVLPGG